MGVSERRGRRLHKKDRSELGKFLLKLAHTGIRDVELGGRELVNHKGHDYEISSIPFLADVYSDLLNAIFGVRLSE